MKQRINWKRLWRNFNKACDDHPSGEWRFQQRKIKELVEKQLREKP